MALHVQVDRAFLQALQGLLRQRLHFQLRFQRHRPEHLLHGEKNEHRDPYQLQLEEIPTRLEAMCFHFLDLPSLQFWYLHYYNFVHNNAIF